MNRLGFTITPPSARAEPKVLIFLNENYKKNSNPTPTCYSSLNRCVSQLTALYKKCTVPPLCPLTVSAHAQRQALLQAAVLAAVTVSPVDQTVPLPGTRIHGVVLLTAAEEALNKQKRHQLLAHCWLKGDIGVIWVFPPHLAAFAGDDSIVDS